MMSSEILALVAIAFAAAIVNGALGYGFSSITVPLALLLVANRVLNPAMVLLELALNTYVLWVNRAALPRVWRRALPIALGIGPGVTIGTIALTRVNSDWLKLATFALLLPLMLLQVTGFRRPIRAERSVGGVFGVGVGVLYAITTLSGPPLAIFFTNQGFAKQEFRAALGLIRVVEATLTSIAYANAQLFTPVSVSLVAAFAPSVAIGVPIGAWVIRRVPPETFRRVCMSFDAAIVAFGISKLLGQLHLIDGALAFLPLLAVVAFDAVLLYHFCRAPISRTAPCAQPQPS